MGGIVLAAVALLIGWMAVGWGWPMWLAVIVGGAAGVLARFIVFSLIGAALVGTANRLPRDESSSDGQE